MSLHLFAAFWAVSMLFIITPGADWAYSISAGLHNRAVIPAVMGLLCGHLIATLVVAAGVGALVTGVPAVLAALTATGAGYLLWLGITMLRHPAAPTASNSKGRNSASWWAIRGLCVSGMNPKVFLLFLALLPQFTDAQAAWPLPLQILALGLLHIFSCGVVYLLVGYGSKVVLQTRPRAAQIVSRISGGLMIIIAVFLLTGQLLTGN
ncbi:LysE family translocator [Dickeya dadantii]|uniref:LysE family translocator n=1 Tax=Dickeya dadantii TaxID=204038 RepID=UPI001C0E4753|nr:LysE family translocator [Dickeya dadantii]MCA7014904.1 LysE family translocator [Dickeya dadantii]QWT40264.1 LysE family translocator [Dickeya dadantii]